jgi:hypothetical protein
VGDRFFSTGSRRDNADNKPPFSKVMWEALREVALVHKYGDDHYGMGNWRKGQPFSSPIDSALRHIEKTLNGEDKDPDSGQYHMAHAAWNCLFLLHMLIHYDYYGHQLDDRLDFKGDWHNEEFAKTALAKLLEAGKDNE